MAQADKIKRKPLTAEEIYGFSEMFLRRDFDEASETPQAHLEWWEMCCDPHPQVAIAAPRGHAKTTGVTLTYGLATICFRERSFVLIVSDTFDQATMFVGALKKELSENEDLMKMFGIKGIDAKVGGKDTESDFIVMFEDGHQARVIGKGAGQRLRGLLWDKKRPDLVLLDDLENDEIVLNKERRESFRKWFMAALLPVISKRGIFRYIGTILHMDSMLERLMPKPYMKDVERTELCEKGSKKRSWYSAKYKAHNRDFSQILWPARWTEEELKQKRQSYLDDGQGDKYAQEYLNQPIDESTAEFRRTDFTPMDESDRAAAFQKRMHFYVGTDLATKSDQKTDFSVFAVGGVDDKGLLHVIDVIRGRFDSVELCDIILDINKRYDPHYFFFEKGAITNSILPVLSLKMIEDDNYVTTQLMARVVDKVQYAQAIKQRMRTHRVKFDMNQEWFPDFEQEALRFPRDLHDDQVDALAILGHGVKQFVEAATLQQKADEDYEEERSSSGVLEAGRSSYTGY
jgi:predicted phage terminase large subunit-like protein